VSVRIPAI